MDCQAPEISVLDDKLLFTCEGAESGKYELNIQLLHDINTKVSDGGVVLTISLNLSHLPAGVSLRRQGAGG